MKNECNKIIDHRVYTVSDKKTFLFEIHFDQVKFLTYIFFHTKFLSRKRDGDVDGADLQSSLSYCSAISLSISLHPTQ